MRSVFGSMGKMAGLIFHFRKILFATTRVEISKRYAGSSLGLIWVVLYPMLLLSVYLFVYLVVFKMRFPGYSGMDYVLYVFAGLVPFIGLSEAIQAGSVSLKQNIHLVKNVMLPLELIPVRAVTSALVGQCVLLALVAILAAANGTLSPFVLLLPVVLVLQMLLLLGVVFVLSAVSLVVQDVNYFVNLALMLLMFLSPIGYRPEMLPPEYAAVVWLNPVSYLCDAYRFTLLSTHSPSPAFLWAYALSSLAAFALGSAFFLRFKGALVDYE
ncbi:MAG TPA: ABC transporter permease [Humidesulfovibrio sp.]|uniref:ABC transporter permease n=1 Tax=Humidesulfovibrio sp. TaxID=2910988 RepID=UPI002C8DF819|nr:ABC transporter permease [Humidesulfovibrio sp.]HWR02667.1 ABC transporter permease [Humidesulfovibrio sp.]